MHPMSITRWSLAVLTLLAHAPALIAEPLFNPANGHYYDAIDETNSWIRARDNAAERLFTTPDGRKLRGHLATITAQDEHDFIGTHFPFAFGSFQHEYWIGGF